MYRFLKGSARNSRTLWLRDVVLPRRGYLFKASRRSDYNSSSCSRVSPKAIVLLSRKPSRGHRLRPTAANKRGTIPWWSAVGLWLQRGSWELGRRFATSVERRFCSEFDAFG